MENEELTANRIEKILRDSLQSINKLESTVASQAKTIESLTDSNKVLRRQWEVDQLDMMNLTKERDDLQNKLSGFDALLDTMNDQAKREFDKLKADNFFLENEKDGLIQENKKLRETFCSCSSEVKTGNIQVKHCNICGKIEPEETWFKTGSAPTLH